MRRQILIALGVLMAVVAIVIGWYFITQRHVGRLVAQGERTNILILGLDKVGQTSRSDTMMLLSMASGENVSLISVPRDLRVKLTDGEFHKLNAAYAKGGANEARQAVADLLGIEVPFYITLDYAGFERLIDQFGGVTITVDEPMKYDDERADPPLHIDIQAGTQTFDGKTALEYIRYRGETGDLGRIAHQQKLISAILEKGFQNSDYDSIRKMVRTINPYLHTNLSLIDMYDLAKIVQGLDLGRLQMATIPGIPVMIDEISYLQPQVVETEQMVAHLIKGIDLLTPDEVSVAVFNGNGVRMVASRTSDYLSNRDFMITKVANAESFDYDETYIVVLTDKAKGQMLQAALPDGVNSAIVTPDQLQDHYSALAPNVPDGTDLVLIAGKGFDVNQ